VACNPDGYVIGDAILFHLDENKFNLVGRPPATDGGTSPPPTRQTRP
jgi:glycine cleavage system aminomethyltransferase T